MARKVIEYVVKATDKASATLGKVGQSASLTQGQMLALAAGVAAAATAFVGFVQSMADSINQLNDMAVATGFSAETLKGLKLAADGAGLSIGGMEKVLRGFATLVGQAGRGGKTAFDDFGISVRDSFGDLKSQDVILREVIVTLNEMEDPANRAAAATQLLGARGGQLLVALGGGELDSFVAAADRFGTDTGPAATKAADEWQRATAILGLAVQGVGSDLFTAVGPAAAEFVVSLAGTFVGLFTLLSNALPVVGILIFKSIGAPIEIIMVQIKKLIDAIVAMANAMKRVLTASNPKELAKALVGAAAKIKKVGDELTTGVISTAMETFFKNGSSFADDMTNAFQESEKAVAAFDATVRALDTTKAGVGVGGFDLEPTSDGSRSKSRSSTTAPKTSSAPPTQATQAPIPISAPEQEAAIVGVAASVEKATDTFGGGLASMLGALGPAGAIAGAMVGLLADFDEIVSGLAESLMTGIVEALGSLPDTLATLIGDLIPEFIIGLVGALPKLIPKLIVALITSFGKLLKAIVLDIPLAMLQVIPQLISELFQQLGGIFGGGRKRGGTSSVPYGGADGDIITPFATGGIVTRPTIGLIGEAGPEAVIPLGRGGMGGGTVNINIGTYTGTDEGLRDLMREIRRMLGSRGGGEAGLT